MVSSLVGGFIGSSKRNVRGDSSHGETGKSGRWMRRQSGFLSAAVMISLFCLGQAQATTYYVNNAAGNDAAAGTSVSTAWATIGKANATLRVGDTVYIRAGTYYEAIAPINSGTAANPITYRNYPGETVWLKGVYDLVTLTGCNYIIIDGLCGRDQGGRWLVMNNANHCTIKNCSFWTFGVEYCMVQIGTGCSYNQFLDNYFDGLETDPAAADSTGRIQQDTMVFLGNNQHMLLQGNYFTYASHSNFGNRAGCDYNVIRNNIFENKWHSGMGVYYYAPSPNYNLIENNTFRYCGNEKNNSPDYVAGQNRMNEQNGLQWAPGIKGIVRQNVFYKNGTGMSLGGWVKDYDSKIYHNTFYKNYWQVGGNSADAVVSGDIFVNNIFFEHMPNTMDSPPLEYDIDYYVTGDPAARNTWTNNIVASHIGGVLSSALWYGYSSPPYIGTLAQMQGWLPNDWYGNFQVDPLFVDAENGNFTLQPNSPAIGAGKHLTLTVGSGTNSTTLVVQDSGYFFSGPGAPWYVENTVADTIYIEGAGAVQIASIDYATNTITLASPMMWTSGKKIYHRPYSGNGPDIGAYEYQGNSATYTLTISAPATGRYVRMLGTQRATPFGYSLYEFEVYGSGNGGALDPGSVNLALGKTAVASSIEDGTMPASNATDGNLYTRWSSLFSDPQWIYVDLGSVCTINRIVLRWEAAYSLSYKLQVSNDATTWSDVSSTTTGDGGVDDITLSATNGTVTRTPDQISYTSGQTVTLQATPNAGYVFSGWSGDLTGTTNPATLTMNANKSVTANFTAVSPITYTLTVSAMNGTAAKTPDQTSYTSGQTVTLQATPNAGYTFSGWSGDLTGTTNPATLTMNSNKLVTANFSAAPAPTTYTLTVSAVYGTVTKTPDQTSYTSGQTVTLQATPNTGYTFSGWSGDLTGTMNPVTLTMNSNKSVTANFSAAPAPMIYTLTVSAANGTVTKTPDQTSYTTGQTVTLQATSNAGYIFSGWSGDLTGSANPTTLVMNANKSVTASFVVAQPATYYVDLAAGNDNNDGKSPATAWQSIGKVNSYTGFVPGDQILFHRGHVWREQLVVPTSGTADKPITFGAYDTGDRPLLMGSVWLSRWTSAGPNLWTASLSTAPDQVFVNGIRGTQMPSPAALAGPQQWSWAAGVLYVYATSDPSSITTAVVEASVRPAPRISGLIQIQDRSYVTVQDLQVSHSASAGICITGAGQGLTIRNCEADNSDDGGIVAASPTGALSDVTVESCLIHHNNGGLQDAGSVDLALGKTAVASSTEDSSLPAANGTDGDFYSRWSSLFSDDQWIYVDLGSVCTINRVVLRWEVAYGRSYQLQVSNDASTWSTVYSTTTGAGGVEEIPLSAPATGRYVRMRGVQRATMWGYSLYEFEVYGSGSVLGAATYRDGLTVEGVHGFAVRDCQISGNYARGVGLEHGSTNGVLENCQVNGNGLVNLHLDGVSNTQIRYNKIYDGAADGGLQFGLETSAYDNDGIQVYYNLFWNDTRGISFTALPGVTSQTRNVSILNNTFYNHPVALHWESAATGHYSGANNVKNNLLWAQAATNTGIRDETTGQQGIAQTAIVCNGFQQGAATDTTGTNAQVMADPYFVDPAAYDFHRSSISSPTIDTGTAVGLSRDFDGDPVPQGSAPDIGAYEAAGSPAVTYLLTVSATNGTVTKTPDQAGYTAGQTVTLQVAPNTGYTFTGWSGDLTGTTNPATLTMDANKSVTANFAAVPAGYTLTVGATNGTVTKTPDQTSYTSGQTVTLQATPNAGYTFSGWSGDLTGTTNPVTLTMNSNKSVTANFSAAPAPTTYTLTVSAVYGTVTKTPNQTSYTPGQTVTLQAIPNTGFKFTGWSGDLTGTTNPATLVMNGNKSVTATFRFIRNGKKPRSLAAPTVAGTDVAPVPNSTGAALSAGALPVNEAAASANDQQPPVLGGRSPAPDSIQAAPDTLVVLRVCDEGQGVDAASVSIQVDGHLIYTGDAASYHTTYGVCTRSGTEAQYTYAYQQQGGFGYSRKVMVAVGARDRAGNVMPEQTYSFDTEMYSFGANRIIATDQPGLAQGKPATARDEQGNVWIVWHAGISGSRHVYAARLQPDGKGPQTQNSAFGSPTPSHGTVQLSQGAGDHCHPALAIDATGTLYVVWQENAGGVWNVCVSASMDGQTWSAPKPLAGTMNVLVRPAVNRIHPAVAAGRQSGSLVAVAWQEGPEGNQDICVVSSTNRFETATVSRVTSDPADQTDPAIAVDGQDTIFVLWTDARNGSTDIYGAASNAGPWTNVPVVTGENSQSHPALTAGLTGRTLHMAWVEDKSGNLDVFYAATEGLPTSPLAGASIIDDTSGANQQAPALGVAAGADGTDRVFVCWEDARNIAYSGAVDVYCADVSPGALRTNVLVDDDGTSGSQHEPVLGIDRCGYPYIVWVGDAGTSAQLYYSGATYANPVPLTEEQIVSSAGGLVGTSPKEITTLDDVSVAIPALTCPVDTTIRAARIRNPRLPAGQSGSPNAMNRVWEQSPGQMAFGPSGLVFTQPVTITIPYSPAGHATIDVCWFDAATGTFRQDDIANVRGIPSGSGPAALQFETTHLRSFYLVSGIVP